MTAEDQINPFEEVEAKELARWLVERACQELTPTETEILKLTCEDFTETEIGEQIGKSIGAVRKWKGRIKIKINKSNLANDYL